MSKNSGPTGTLGGAAGSVSQQATDMTRNFILGIPAGGLSSQSEEAAELHAAETFIGDIQQEILAYDIANAQAMESYARKWWSRVPFFGRRARAELEAEAEAKRQQVQAEQQELRSAAATSAGEEDSTLEGGLVGLDVSQAAAAVGGVGSGTTFLHKQAGMTGRRGFQVERTSAVDPSLLEDMLKRSGGAKRGGVASAAGAAGKAAPPKMNSWLFKRKHPGWTPLMQRWWVPWACIGALALVWTPDVWKLRTLYYCDWQYAMLRQRIHKAYWRATMSKEDYNALMADIEAMRPPTVKSTDCPF